ncbi:hypothetical protein HDU67_009479 [Dinochytrium kinnereticum]|nr:hypothetical protein HDU67_009479 [Dinochytrium kinnereticum]
MVAIVLILKAVICASAVSAASQQRYHRRGEDADESDISKYYAKAGAPKPPNFEMAPIGADAPIYVPPVASSKAPVVVPTTTPCSTTTPVSTPAPVYVPPVTSSKAPVVVPTTTPCSTPTPVSTAAPIVNTVVYAASSKAPVTPTPEPIYAPLVVASSKAPVAPASTAVYAAPPPPVTSSKAPVAPPPTPTLAVYAVPPPLAISSKAAVPKKPCTVTPTPAYAPPPTSSKAPVAPAPIIEYAMSKPVFTSSKAPVPANPTPSTSSNMIAAVAIAVLAVSAQAQAYDNKPDTSLSATVASIPTTTAVAPKKTYTPECDDEVEVNYSTKTKIAVNPGYATETNSPVSSAAGVEYGTVPATKKPVAATNLYQSGAESVKVSVFAVAAAGVAAMFV